MSKTWDNWKSFYDRYTAAFAHPLTSNELLGGFVSNPNVTGAYAEAWVRATAKRMLSRRFAVSTGAIISPSDKERGLQSVPQCDLIIWDPSELPGILECGEFALVPLITAQAVIEIKRHASDAKDLQKQIEIRSKRLPKQGVGLGILVQHPDPLFRLDDEPDWLTLPGIQPKVIRLLDGKGKPDSDGVRVLIRFLSHLAGHDGLTPTALRRR